MENKKPKCLYDTPKSCENSQCRVQNKCNGDKVRPKQEQDKNKYNEQDMQEYATFCIRCYEQGLPCIIAQDWFKIYKNK
jgi:hypothetical protein